MRDNITEFVDAVRRHYDDGCFACGRDNPIGLHLDEFDLRDRVVSARFAPREHYRGVAETLHGGIAATALDEILVWAGILTEKVMSVTGTMQLRFRKPLTIGKPIVASARVEQRSGRRLQLSGDLSVDDDVRVTGSGLYLVTADIADLLDDFPAHPES